MKKLLALLLCGAMVIGTTACGGAGGTGGTQSGGSADQGAGDSGSKQASGDTTEVVFWHSFSGATEAALTSIINEYNEGRGKEKGIHVELVYQGYEGS